MGLPTAATRAVLEELFAALDYQGLGPIYCDEGGDEFWAAHRGPALRMGIQWARALADRLGSGASRASRASLYVGAGVAELPALVVEVLDLSRTVRVCSLEAEECRILNAGLQAVGLLDRIRYECGDATAVPAGPGFDHVSLVSVLCDPIRYPMVSGLSYGRLPPVQLDVPAFEAERTRLRALAGALLDALRRPGLVTTTFEETPWLLEAAADRGLTVDADEAAIDTAIVGDPIGFLRVT